MPQVTIEQAIEIALRHHRSGQLAEAESIYQQVIQRDPNQAVALHMLGVVNYQSGRAVECIALIRRALALRADWPQALGNLGVALTAVGQFDEAIICHRRELALAPSSAAAACNLGNALRAAGQIDEAVAAHRRAIAIRPGFAEAHHNLGNALRDQNELDEAMESYRRAIALRSDYGHPHNSLGAVLRAIGKNEEAIACFRRAIQIQPNHAEAHFNLAVVTLLLGDFQVGWREYEWRWQLPNRRDPAKDFSQPRWDGSDLAGRTIFLFAEQGIGDTIQFLRYLPLVNGRGGRVLLDVHPSLHRLLNGGNLHGATLASRLSASFDVYLPLLSLPLVLGEFDFGSQDVAKPPYIRPDPASPGLLSEDHGFKVGLVWAGSPSHVDDRRRSISLASLASLAHERIHFFSLQLGKAAAEVVPPGMNLTDLTGQIEDFADTAALIAELDLVVSVDTAVAHLAGAMGKPVWVLLPLAPDFRWLLDREDTLWYPTMRLFRQRRFGDWADPIERVVRALHQSI